MPKRKLTINGRELTLDARPDRLDLRDLPFRPSVDSLPAVYPSDKGVAELLPAYQHADLVLDQGKEGACTGFGMAAVINYLLWVRSGYKMTTADKVSERMLYHLARFYDEWPGEDYEGSSCRGALKGWHRHGVCLESLWPYRDPHGDVCFVSPNDTWELDAVRRPLGVYYRVQRESVVDIQAAIWQTGAVYVSANVHEGWEVKTVTKPVCHDALPAVKPSRKGLGGHAFALVGYNDVGFIVQNSWGKQWGASGFAVLPYEEWVLWGTDAWVIGLGAPIAVSERARTASRSLAAPRRHFLPPSAGGVAGAGSGLSGFFRGDKLDRKKHAWSTDTAYNHTLVTGNDGCTINRLLHVANEQKNAEYVALTKPLEWFRQRPAGEPWRLAIYAHGGLNSEEDSIQRIRLMGPQFEANGIYPVFMTWKSGWQETIGNMLEDGFKKEFAGRPPPAEGMSDAFTEASDRAIEVLSREVLARSLWSEMKENVARAVASDRGFSVLAAQVRQLALQAGGKLEVHLVGHSAGSYVLGRVLGALDGGDGAPKVGSCSLYAPACDLEFALQFYKAAIDRGQLPRAAFRVHALNDTLERADSIGPYRKSLLYLVSRALERWHKTPLLGLASAWDADCVSEEQWHKDTLDHVRQWQAFAWNDGEPPQRFAELGKPAPGGSLLLLTARQVDCGPRRIASTHSCFDNSVEVVGQTLKAILGGSLVKDIDDLDF